MPQATRDEITVLKAVAAHYVMLADDRARQLATQREALGALVARLLATGEEHLEPEFRADLRRATDDAARTRVVIDQVASLTDGSARLWADRLLG
ncbi:MAG: hypothetical protein PGN15_08755 [Aeromicrobium erythreum]